MQITVSGKQVDLSDALRVRVSDQLGQITGKFFDQAQEAHVTFGRSRSFFTCDINLHAGRGLTLRGEAEAADANSAFDNAANHIATRLRKYRKRVSKHHHDLAEREAPEAGRRVVLKPNEEHVDEPAAITETATGHEAFATVVAETATQIHSLTPGEAVMRLDLEHQHVLMFRNSATNTLNVVYRREDGHIGWIAPQA